MPSTPTLRDYDSVVYHGVMFIKKPTAPRSFRAALYVGTRKAVVSTLLLGASLFISTHLITPSATMVAPEAPTAPAVEAAATHGEARLTHLLDTGACWTGGDGHDYPSFVVEYHAGSGYTWKGQDKVDFYLSDFSRINDSVKAFCTKE